MKILILSWRDIKNPSSGGAEILTHELAKYLVKKKNVVTLFTSRFEGSVASEKIDGVTIIRDGESIARHLFSSVHFLAYKAYKKRFQGKIDLVIDEVHGLPFFTPWYVTEKKVALVCEVAGSLWVKMFGLLLGSIGRVIEMSYLRFIYRFVPFITISHSAKRDLVKNGVDKKNIAIIPVGVNIPSVLPSIKREKVPTLIMLGRVSKSKGVEDGLLALKELSKKRVVKMWIVGRQDPIFKRELRKFVEINNLDSQVKFFDYVTEKEKFELLSRAWVLVHASKTEGWGINVIEANSVGVPTVGYNVPGLQDSIQDGETGLLTQQNNLPRLIEAIERLLTDRKLYEKLSIESMVWAKKFNWEKTGEETWKILKKVYEE